ncbi:MAG: D-alanyl-D-alanine carboxypeptidase family protein [Patescibacteria group bacterium]
MSFGIKIRIWFILGMLRVLLLIEYLGTFPERLLSSSSRLIAYAIIVISLFTGFYLETKNAGDFIYYYTPKHHHGSIQKVLGASKVTLPIKISENSLPDFDAQAIYAVDIVNNQVLVSNNIYTKLPPASTAKLLTALVSLDIYRIDEIIVVPELCTLVESQKAGLYAFESLSVADLLDLLLIGSAGDAACTLSVGKISQEEFVVKMNQKAQVLGLKNSNFTNPVGLDDELGNNYSTAYDLYLLSKAAISDDYIKQIVVKKEVSVLTSLERAVYMNTTNDLLLEIPQTLGIKTGRTTGAGEVLSYMYGDEKKKIIIIVMGSANRAQTTKQILSWILENYSWELPTEESK